MTINDNDKAIITSNSGYLLLTWATIFFILTMGLIVWIFSCDNITNYIKIILTILAILFSIYIASFFCFYKISFYKNRIVANYQINFPVNRDKIIDIRQIKGLRFIYNDTPHSGGIGIFKVYYIINGHNKILRCPISPSDIAMYYKSIKDTGIIFELAPKEVLDKYLT